MADGKPWFAPDEMPEFVADAEGKEKPWEKRWVAAETATGAFAVILEDSFDEDTGKALTVAMCPHPDFAQYIAHFHNMLLRGSAMLNESVGDVLKAYATQSHPPGCPCHPPATPPETGGYL